MADEIAQAAETVAEVIAAEATAIVADQNETTTQAEEVNSALIAAELETIHGRRLTQIEEDGRARHDKLYGDLFAALERLAQCETRIQEMLLTMAVPPALIVTETSLIPPPSPPPSVEEVALPSPALEPEAATENPPPPPPVQKRKRHRLL